VFHPGVEDMLETIPVKIPRTLGSKPHELRATVSARNPYKQSVPSTSDATTVNGRNWLPCNS
jgi:hypothetical protein